MRKILVATHNPGKLEEYRALLAENPVTFISLADLGITDDIAETGDSFEENAVLKALSYFRLSGLPTLADDSGLEVDALQGAPGIYSSRYAGPGATDVDRYQKLLHELRGVPEEKRTARFRCVVAFARSEESLITREGACEGTILEAPRGSGGFGYDPVFFIASEGAAMAELPAERKNQISHRAEALRKLRAELLAWSCSEA